MGNLEVLTSTLCSSSTPGVATFNFLYYRIDHHGVIKVADFGLTEDMYCTNYYHRGKSRSGNDEKVPIRWMAPESIEEDIYNETTDVVSLIFPCTQFQ